VGREFFSATPWPWSPPSLLSNGYRKLFPWGKTAGAWSWPLTSSWSRDQRMRGAILPLPQYVFLVWCIVKHRDKFTFKAFSVMVMNTHAFHAIWRVRNFSNVIMLIACYFQSGCLSILYLSFQGLCFLYGGRLFLFWQSIRDSWLLH